MSVAIPRRMPRGDRARLRVDCVISSVEMRTRTPPDGGPSSLEQVASNANSAICSRDVVYRSLKSPVQRSMRPEGCSARELERGALAAAHRGVTNPTRDFRSFQRGRSRERRFAREGRPHFALRRRPGSGSARVSDGLQSENAAAARLSRQRSTSRRTCVGRLRTPPSIDNGSFDEP